MAQLIAYNLGDIHLSDGMSKTNDISSFVNDTVSDAVGSIPPVPLSGGFSISYDSESREVSLKYDGQEIDSFDASDFVKDGMISDVTYDEGTQMLSILWNSDGDSKVSEICLSGLIDTYSAGEGLALENGTFSLTAEIPSRVTDLEDGAELTGNVSQALTLGQEANQAANTAQSTANNALSAALSADAKAEDALQGVADAMNYADEKDQDLSASLTTDLQEWTWQQGYSNQFWSFGNGLSVIPPEPTRAAPAVDSNAPSVVVADTAVMATREYVDEGHGYLFSDPHFTVIQSPYGKTIGLSDVCFTDDYYVKGTFDECLSAIRPYDSPSEVPLSAVVNAIWCLSKLREWVTPGS